MDVKSKAKSESRTAAAPSVSFRSAKATWQDKADPNKNYGYLGLEIEEMRRSVERDNWKKITYNCICCCRKR